MNQTLLRRFLVLFVAAATLGAASACASKKTAVNPFELVDENQRPADLLDEPVAPTQRGDRRGEQRQSSSSPALGAAAAQPARTIDAQPDDWDLTNIRRFGSRDHVVQGAGRWSGPGDASFAVALDADESHLYFWIEVTDDQVVHSNPEGPLDGVVIWLRDPALDRLLNALPPALQGRLNLYAETAVAITPDGQFARYGSQVALPPGAVHVATRKTETGYNVEVAFSVEVLLFTQHLPLEDIAFRVELIDSDDPAATRPQKRLSMLPQGEGAPRFAIYGTPGLLPAAAISGGPARYDALGIWRQRRQNWEFQSLEYHSPNWRVVENPEEIAAQIDDERLLPEICHGPSREMTLIEAYDSNRRGQRVALILCGTRAEGQSCRSGATSQLFWTALRQQEPELWSIERSHAVFSEPLHQCSTSTPATQRLYSGFSLLPLDVVGPSVWGVGWHMEQRGPQQLHQQSGLFFVDPRSENFIVGDTPLTGLAAEGNQRRLHRSRVYLTPLNDDDSMDICEIEDVQDQNCTGFNAGCETRPRGHEVLPHIKTWNSAEHRFERFLFNRHQGCRGSMGFADFEGYKVLLIQGRLGLVRTR